MTDGVLQLVGGKVLIADSGVATTEDCCCGAGVCPDCEDSTPEHLTFTLTGLTECGCIDLGGGYSERFTFDGDPNQAYALDWGSEAAPCVWTKTISAIRYAYWNGSSTCTGDPDVEEESFDIDIEVSREDGKWKVQVNAPSLFVDLFVGEVADPGCTTERNVSNTLVAGNCGLFETAQGAYGGTATITPNP